MTLRQALTAARDRLVDAGVAPDEAAIDVELFARTILGWDRARIITASMQGAPAALEPTFSAWVARRATREPSAYIIGMREFYNLELEVTPAVLIPRPETEMIVEAALPLLVRTLDARVADVGTGCGNIAVTLAHEARAQHGGRDRRLGRRAGGGQAQRRASRRRSTASSSCRRRTSTASRARSISSPPTRRTCARSIAAGLSPSVLHEPAVALFGGANGMRDIEGVLEAAVAKLRQGGWLIMEFGFGQEDDVRARVAVHDDLRLDRVVADLQGLPRTAVITRIAANRRGADVGQV